MHVARDPTSLEHAGGGASSSSASGMAIFPWTLSCDNELLWPKEAHADAAATTSTADVQQQPDNGECSPLAAYLQALYLDTLWLGEAFAPLHDFVRVLSRVVEQQLALAGTNAIASSTNALVGSQPRDTGASSALLTPNKSSASGTPAAPATAATAEGEGLTALSEALYLLLRKGSEVSRKSRQVLPEQLHELTARAEALDPYSASSNHNSARVDASARTGGSGIALSSKEKEAVIYSLASGPASHVAAYVRDLVPATGSEATGSQPGVPFVGVVRQWLTAIECRE